MRFSFPYKSVSRGEEIGDVRFSVYVYMDTLLSTYIATLITREEKHENFKRNVLIRSIQFFLARSRDRNHFSFSLVVKNPF